MMSSEACTYGAMSILLMISRSDLVIPGPVLQVVDGRQVHRGIFAYGYVGAAAGFNAKNAVGRQGVVLQQEVGVFSCIDVVGHHGDVVVVFQGTTQLAQQCSFAGAYRAANAYSQAKTGADLFSKSTSSHQRSRENKSVPVFWS
jgi:hypothetical protein